MTQPERPKESPASGLLGILKVLGAAERQWKQTLRGLLEGADPEEKDLVSFKGDAEFRDVLS